MISRYLATAVFILSGNAFANDQIVACSDMTNIELNKLENSDAAFGLISRNCAVRVRAEEVDRALADEQTKQARLRDRLATADLRLSVQLDAIGSNGSGGVQATTGAGGVVYGTARAQLAPEHAQRIIGITGDDDQGLIALQACQAFAKEVSGKK